MKLTGVRGPGTDRPRKKNVIGRNFFRPMVEILEDRDTPSATITSTSTSINILVPTGEIAVLDISGGNYTITDSAGINAASTGGKITGKKFTANDPATGQTAFGIAAGSAGIVQLAAANVIPTTTSVTISAGTLDL